MSNRALLLLALFLASLAFLIFPEKLLPLSPWQKKAQLETPERMAAAASIPNRVPGWPPQVGRVFPPIHFIDHEGKAFSLDSLKGKPVLVEIIAMSCAGCEAYAGGAHYGGFEGFAVQPRLGTIDYYARKFGGVSPFDPRLNFVQIIIYNLFLNAPVAPELAAWRKHFHFDAYPNTFVVSGGPDLANGASFNMIPGFYLLDSTGKVLFDAAGHTPKHDLYTQLLPAIRGLVR
jgi:hypothetical protein